MNAADLGVLVETPGNLPFGTAVPRTLPLLRVLTLHTLVLNEQIWPTLLPASSLKQLAQPIRLRRLKVALATKTRVVVKVAISRDLEDDRVDVGEPVVLLGQTDLKQQPVRVGARLEV